MAYDFIVRPFINQMVVMPVTLLRHTMSCLPSPSKSATNCTDQFRSERRSFEAVVVAPFISHALVVPDVVRQMRSVLPSPSRSPVCVTDFEVSVSRGVVDKAVSPFISAIDVCPPLLLFHNRSVVPLASKSGLGVLASDVTFTSSAVAVRDSTSTITP